MKAEKEKTDFNLNSVNERIMPLKDFVIKHNDFHYDLKKGVPAEVNKMFIQNLKTEKVI
jgi:hypothetical protein